MTYWHLLWMFVTALGIIGFGLATPFVWGWARDYRCVEEVARRQLLWRLYREHEKEVRERIAAGARITEHRFRL